MKSIAPILASTLLALSPIAVVQAQSPTAAGVKTAITASPAASPATSPGARTDVYHVHFAKAALGKAAALADQVKKGDPNAPMPGHSLVLRHMDGDDWDYAVIEHLGTKATVDAAATPAPAALRDLRAGHTDTFVNGPSWAQFTKEMGIDEGSTAKTASSVYVISVYRPAAGHNDQLETMLGEPPVRPADTSSGNVLMQHLEGANWRFLTIARYNSWQDYATNQSNAVAQAAKNEGGWLQLREHAAFHNDTLTNRIAP